MENFTSSGIHTKQAHVDIPEGLYEEEHGRDGFFGKVSQLYHQNPPTSWTNIDGPLKPRFAPDLFNENLKVNQFETILFNNDVLIKVARLTKTSKNFYRNADADELFFVHQGKGKFETSYGHLDYKKGDYIVIPRGTTYKQFIGEETKVFKVESKSEFEQPSRGLLGPNALYDQTAIEKPIARTGSEEDQSEYIVEIKRLNEITKVTYPFNPLDVMGWKGSVYPWKISIYDICPVMSHKYHIPPSGHTTFVCKNFVVCSFVARPLEDTKEKVLKVPFYHSNIDFDEVLFYHEGDFFSRDHANPGALTFHPQGINHGPHPKAFATADDKTHTDEFAVMVDTKNPLHMSDWLKMNQDKDYWKSWR